MSWTDPRTAIDHFRTATGSEADVALEKPNGSVAAIEVKASATVAASDTAALRARRDQLGGQFSDLAWCCIWATSSCRPRQAVARAGTGAEGLRQQQTAERIVPRGHRVRHHRGRAGHVATRA